MFDDLRRAFRDLMAAPLDPDERRPALAAMRDTLVRAKMALDDVRDQVSATRRRLAEEEAELATVQRRRQLAEQVADAETAAVAAKYEAPLLERVAVRRQKLAVEEQELALAERDVAEMTRDFKAASVGAGARPATRAPLDDEALGLGQDDALRRETDAMARARSRADAEADAEARHAEHKRKLGQG
ncbi:MAG: hypothetical protein ACK6AH_01370 [Gemmatimonadota bacterium]